MVRHQVYHFSPNLSIWQLRLNLQQKYKKINSSEAIRGIKLKLCRIVHISLYKTIVFYYAPPQNRVYTVFSMSTIPKFRQHSRFLLSNFDSFCPILFKFTSHLNHHTMHEVGNSGLKVHYNNQAETTHQIWPKRPRAEMTRAETTQDRNDSGPKRLRAETTRDQWDYKLTFGTPRPIP